jgi:hypothetical protein
MFIFLDVFQLNHYFFYITFILKIPLVVNFLIFFAFYNSFYVIYIFGESKYFCPVYLSESEIYYEHETLQNQIEKKILKKGAGSHLLSANPYNMLT